MRLRRRGVGIYFIHLSRNNIILSSYYYYYYYIIHYYLCGRTFITITIPRRAGFPLRYSAPRDTDRADVRRI